MRANQIAVVFMCQICNLHIYCLFFQVNDRLVCLYFIWAGTNIMVSSYTKVTQVETMEDGKPPV
jgi:hypothetical protein